MSEEKQKLKELVCDIINKTNLEGRMPDMFYSKIQEIAEDRERLTKFLRGMVNAIKQNIIDKVKEL